MLKRTFEAHRRADAFIGHGPEDQRYGLWFRVCR